MTLRRELARVRAQLEARYAPAALPCANAVDLWRAIYHTEPDPWQCHVMLSESSRILMCAARQVGKSSVAAVLALEQVLYHAPSLVLLLSSSLRQSQELGLKLFSAYRRLGRPIPAVGENLQSLSLSNGSRILCLPSTDSTVRGFSAPALIVVDEAARVEDQLYHALRPMLSVGSGKLIALSTPWEPAGWFFRAWQDEDPWSRTRVTAEECPRISPAFLAEEQSILPDWLYRREYLAEFVETTGRLVFRPELVRDSMVDIPPFLFSWEQSG